jgi:hypothetical protein
MNNRHPLDIRRDETPPRPDADFGASVYERIHRRIVEERRQHAHNRAAWYSMRAAAAFDRAWDRAWGQYVLRRTIKGYKELRDEWQRELCDRYGTDVVLRRAEALQRGAPSTARHSTEKRSRP